MDSDDPETNILTTYAIRPEDKPTEEFERQLRVLNSQLEQTSQGRLWLNFTSSNDVLE